MLFTVISFNIRFGLADDGMNNWANRKHAVAELFNKYPADFICVQELNDFQTDFLVKLLPNYNHIGYHKPAPDYWQNNVIFYRNTIECIDKQHFFLSETPFQPSSSWGSRWPRQCTIGRYKAGFRDFICINTHFDFKEPVQHKSAQLIWQTITTQFQDIPAVLTGDFNAEPDSKTYKWFTGKFDKIASSLPDFKETFISPYPGTFHRYTGKPLTGLIDWILYRGDLNFNKCIVIEDSFEGVFPSDHFPIMAYFEI
jgi:endonuclease/exonuclease/phosphatase family metal-dependent hydrolase